MTNLTQKVFTYQIWLLDAGRYEGWIMWYWFLDENKVVGTVKNSKYEVFLFGGLGVEEIALKQLEKDITKIKTSLGLHNDLPVKWDMNHHYIQKKITQSLGSEEYARIRASKEELFSKLLTLLSKYNVEIILSGLGGFNVLSEKDYYDRSLTNVFQRIGMFLKYDISDSKDINANILLDWPRGGDKMYKPICDLYSNAYYRGVDNDGNEYDCGSLINLGCLPHISFTSTIHSPLLQLTDLVLGVAHLIFKWCFLERDKQSVEHYFPLIKPCLRCDDTGNFWGRGLIVSPKIHIRYMKQQLEKLNL